MSADHNDRRRLDDLEPFPGSTDGRPFTDDEIHHLGCTHRDDDGFWINLAGCRSGGSTLTPEEAAARDRQSQRLGYALRHAPHVTNPNAMRDALVDAFGDRPMLGAMRRGYSHANSPELFGWNAVRQQVDAQHADAIERVENPTHSQQPREHGRSFSVVGNGQQRGRTGNRTEKADRAYGIAVLDSECWRVARTPPGTRHDTLVSAAFKVGQRVGADYLDEAEAFANLLGAALDAGLTEHEARTTIRSGLRAGARKPRDAA